jgi:hypothetical protein
MKLNLRDFFWAILVVALGLSLFQRHNELSRERYARGKAELEAIGWRQTIEALGFEIIERDGARQIRRVNPLQDGLLKLEDL